MLMLDDARVQCRLCIWIPSYQYQCMYNNMISAVYKLVTYVKKYDVDERRSIKNWIVSLSCSIQLVIRETKHSYMNKLSIEIHKKITYCRSYF